MGDEQRVSWQELLAQSRDDGKRFVVRANEKLTAFLELESTLRDARKPCWPINASRNVVIDENGN
jgi:hypothetical protein